MSLQDTLLSALTSYGPVVLFVSVLIASIGVPLPVSFLLIAAGAFVEHGDMNYFAVIAASVVGAVIGDHIGYSIGLSAAARWPSATIMPMLRNGQTNIVRYTLKATRSPMLMSPLITRWPP